MVRSQRSSAALIVGTALAASLLPSVALAGENDLVLRRLGECTYQTVDGREVCVSVEPDTAGFEALTSDLGLAVSPKGFAPAETLGEAGFLVAFELGFNTVDASQAYWQAAVEDRDPSDLLMTSQIHVSKGLPFSFEVGGVLTHIFSSEMWALGAELAWAFHEDYFWPVPDLGVRGFVNHVVGAPDLNLTTAGFDILASVPVGLNGVVQLTPYLGYNFTAVFASSRLLDASPEDSTPPIEGSGTVVSVKPEFVFDNITTTHNRFVGGFRLRYAWVNFTFETLIAQNVQSYGLRLGLDF
jgi:hypothetical protein